MRSFPKIKNVEKNSNVLVFQVTKKIAEDFNIKRALAIKTELITRTVKICELFVSQKYRFEW